jgi:hypothetical protein
MVPGACKNERPHATDPAAIRPSPGARRTACCVQPVFAHLRDGVIRRLPPLDPRIRGALPKDRQFHGGVDRPEEDLAGTSQFVELAEAAAQVHRRGGDQDARGGGDAQQGGPASRRSSHGRAAALKRTVSASRPSDLGHPGGARRQSAQIHLLQRAAGGSPAKKRWRPSVERRRAPPAGRASTATGSDPSGS